METQLVIFLAFTSVTLIANTLVVWFGYKAFANVTTKITANVREFQNSSTTRAWLTALESAAAQAVVISAKTKEQVHDFEPVLARAQNVYGFGLAKVDVHFERLCEKISHQAERVQTAIERPAHKIGAAASGIHDVLGVMSGPENDVDASSTPK